jgi:Tol biopolymer transport system component/DNA-binding winged helix-turn-helix (wHTH) protein
MSLESNGLYSFGEFAVDVEQRVLLRNEVPIPLAPKVFDTLLILVEHSGRIVEKDALMSRLWPDSFVEEANLTFNIQQLRKSLGDNARSPRFVETVARRGYRFIAPVRKKTEVTSPTEDEAPARIDVVAAAKSNRSHFSIAATAIVIMVLLGIALWFARGRNVSSASAVPILAAPFKSDIFVTGATVRAVITPNGKYVAYTSESSGKESIWLRKLESSENIQIVSPTNSKYYGLAVSADGDSLYFARRTEGDPYQSIYRVMTFGGIPVKVVENTEGWIGVAPDGKQLSFVRCKYEPEDNCSLYIVDIDGKNERRLLTRKDPYRISDNQFAPDGKSIVFAAGQSDRGARDFRLMRVELGSGAEGQLSPKSFFDVYNLKWLPDGNNLLVAAKETHDGRLRIWQVSATTGEATALTKDATDYSSLSLDKVAAKMIATTVTDTFHLYIGQVEDVNGLKNLGPARSGVAFTADQKLVYAGADADIWTINRDGGEQHQLTNNAFSDFSPRVSPDNRYIFFTSNRSGSTQVWRMNVDGSNQIQITRQQGGYPRLVSSDGKWVYFLSSVNENLWRVPANGGEEAPVTLPLSSLSPAGDLAAFFAPDKSADNHLRLNVMMVAEQKVFKTFRLADERLRPWGIDLNSGWVSDGKAFYYGTYDGSRNQLWRQSLDADGPKLIAELGNDQIAHFAVAPDGKSFAIIRGRWNHDAVLIEGLK